MYIKDSRRQKKTIWNQMRNWVRESSTLVCGVGVSLSEVFFQGLRCVHVQSLVIIGGLYFRLSSYAVFRSSVTDSKGVFISSKDDGRKISQTIKWISNIFLVLPGLCFSIWELPIILCLFLNKGSYKRSE